MAIDFDKMMKEEMAKIMKKGGKEGNPTVKNSSMRVTGIRCCSHAEKDLWVANRKLAQQGAGYSLDSKNLREELLTTIKFGKRLTSEVVLVLRNCPPGLAENYTFEGRPTLKKINSVADGNSTMIANMSLDGSADDITNLIWAVINNREIMER